MKLKLINIHDGVAHFHLIDEDGTKRGISVPCNEASKTNCLCGV